MIFGNYIEARRKFTGYKNKITYIISVQRNNYPIEDVIMNK